MGGVTGEARVATDREVIEVLESPAGVGHVVAAKGIQHLLTMLSLRLLSPMKSVLGACLGADNHLSLKGKRK